MKKKNKQKYIYKPFVDIFVKIGSEYANYEYISEMQRIGIPERQLPSAALEFALDNMPLDFDRLNEAEQKEVEKILKKYFKGVLS